MANTEKYLFEKQSENVEEAENNEDEKEAENNKEEAKEEEESFLMRSFVWVFRSPDGRFTQTDLPQPSHETWWDIVLSVEVLGRVVIHTIKWIHRK